MAIDATTARILAAAPPILSLRASLQGIRPEIWRKLLMRSAATLQEAHQAMQAAFGWWDYHLYEFTIDGLVYDCEEADLSAITLAHIYVMRITSFHYLYDFGDRWRIIVDLEDAGGAESVAYPRLVGAARNARPEDVGGTPGYERYADTLKNGSRSERQELIAWRGKFDPVKPDIMDIHKGLVEIGGCATPGAAQTGDEGSVMVSAFYSPKF